MGRSLVLLIVVPILAMFLVVPLSYAGMTELVSVDSDGNEANSWSNSSSISHSGRFVVFVSAATNLVPSDTNGNWDVFLHDRDSGVTELVSVDSNGNQANDRCSYPSVSTDGRYVAFMSGADNLVDGDTNGSQDVFVHDRADGVTRRVSVSSSGAQAYYGAANVAISMSSDGRYIAFGSGSYNLVPGDTNGYLYGYNGIDIFVHDTFMYTTERVSVGSNGEQTNANSLYTSISANGRFVAFQSHADNLFDGDTNGTGDIFVHDRQTSTTQVVSLGNDGQLSNGYSNYLAISEDGSAVAFTSLANNLVVGDTNNTYDVFVRDMIRGITERANVSSDGVQANSFSSRPVISADGRYVAFNSRAKNLVPDDGSFVSDIFVRDRVEGTTERVNVNDGGIAGNDDSLTPSISGNGRYVTFSSKSSNLVPGDTNGQVDIFVRDQGRVVPDPAYDLSGKVGIDPSQYHIRDMVFDPEGNDIYWSTWETGFCGLFSLMRYNIDEDTVDNNLNNTAARCQAPPNVQSIMSVTLDSDTNTIFGGTRGRWWGGLQSYSIDTGTYQTVTSSSITAGMPSATVYNSAEQVLYVGTSQWDGAGGEFFRYNIATGQLTNLTYKLTPLWGYNSGSNNAIYAIDSESANHVIYFGGNAGKLVRYNTPLYEDGTHPEYPAADTAYKIDLSSTSWGSSIIRTIYYEPISGSVYIGGNNGRLAVLEQDGLGNISVVDLSADISGVVGSNIIYDITFGNGELYIAGYSGTFMKYNVSTGEATDLSDSIASFWGTKAVLTLAYDSNSDAVFLGGQHGGLARYKSYQAPPTADAGIDKSIETGCGRDITLDGSASTDPDGDILSYTWTGPFGTVTGVNPIVTIPLGTHTITLTVDDGNGGTDSDQVIITVVDTRPPSTSAVISGTSINDGWYVSPVTVNLLAMDNCSGAASLNYSVNGTSQTVTGTTATIILGEGLNDVSFYAVDQAGNAENPIQLPVNIDLTAPIITINGIGEGAVYPVCNTPTPSYDAVDALSGLAATSASTSQTTGIGLVPYTYSVTASDMAGNPATAAMTYEVVEGVGGLIALVQRYLNLGLIGPQMEKSLLAQLQEAQRLKSFINHVQAQSGEKIDQVAADMLINAAICLNR